MKITNVLELLDDNPKGSFLDLLPFNQHTFGTCNFTGTAPGWEVHTDTDEFFYVLSGRMEITLLQDHGPQQYVAPAGSAFVVPRGVWHKPGARSGARFIHFTPGKSLYSSRDDPRRAQSSQQDP